jgi:hypothetical protein
MATAVGRSRDAPDPDSTHYVDEHTFYCYFLLFPALPAAISVANHHDRGLEAKSIISITDPSVGEFSAVNWVGPLCMSLELAQNTPKSPDLCLAT